MNGSTAKEISVVERAIEQRLGLTRPCAASSDSPSDSGPPTWYDLRRDSRGGVDHPAPARAVGLRGVPGAAASRVELHGVGVRLFPGGAAEAGEDARTAAARELFEEAGVLLAKSSESAAGAGETLELTSQDEMRSHILGGASSASVLAQSGLSWSTESLVPWSH